MAATSTHETRPQASPASRQAGQRAYNERAVLQVVRQNPALVAADIARLTGLTAQSVSTIVRRLLAEGLLHKGAPRRGKVGQPGIPLTLNPDGAFALGITLGRRQLETLLLDFSGQVRHRWRLDHHHPEPAAVLRHLGAQLQALPQLMGAEAHARLVGIGLATPLQLEGWAGLLDMPAATAAAWQGLDLRGALALQTPLPVLTLKDTAAACLADGLTNPAGGHGTRLYAYIDTFIGGALVIDGRLHLGRGGNAGAIGSMPVGWRDAVDPGARAGLDARGASGGDRLRTEPQLLQQASLLTLERALLTAGLDTSAAEDGRALQTPWAEHAMAWVQHSATALARAIGQASALLELDQVVVDGRFHPALRQALAAALPAALDRLDWQGMRRPPLRHGGLGPEAKALGAAWWPLHLQFAPDPALLLQALAPNPGA